MFGLQVWIISSPDSSHWCRLVTGVGLRRVLEIRVWSTWTVDANVACHADMRTSMGFAHHSYNGNLEKKLNSLDVRVAKTTFISRLITLINNPAWKQNLWKISYPTGRSNRLCFQLRNQDFLVVGRHCCDDVHEPSSQNFGNNWENKMYVDNIWGQLNSFIYVLIIKKYCVISADNRQNFTTNRQALNT